MIFFSLKPFSIPEKWKSRLLIMKLSTFLLLLSFLQASATTYSQSVKFNINLDNAHLRDAFSEIQKQSDYLFFYNSEELNVRQNITIQIEDAAIEDVMNMLLIPIGLKHEIVDNYIIVKVSPTPAKMISGKVLDEFNQGLIGTTVWLKGTTEGTTTDFDGKYALEVKDSRDTLVFSYTGYRTQEVAINGRTIIDIQMQSIASDLEEVVVVGYGTTKREDLTGSIATVENKDFNIQPTSQSVDQMLGGQLAGVQVAQTSSRPGSGSIVNIRGVSSVRGDNQPLYVVDGIPVLVTEEVPTGFAGGDQLNGRAKFYKENPLLAINPNDIESINVLKDASAAAIYGSRAANGVVLITTKKGYKSQKGQLNFNYSINTQSTIEEHKLMNAAQYKEYITTVANNTLIYAPNDPSAPVILNDDRGGSFPNGQPYFGTDDTNWKDHLFNDNPVSHIFNLNYSGGNTRTRYYVALNAADQEGFSTGNNFKNYGIRTNVDTEVSDRLNLGATLSYNRSHSKVQGSGLATYSPIFTFQPTYGIYEDDGVTYTTYQDRFRRVTFNPVARFEQETNNYGNNFLGSIYAEYELLKGLKLKSTYNAYLFNSRTRRYRPIVIATSFADLDITNSQVLNTTWANTLSYNTTFGVKHNLHSVLGMSLEHRELDQTGIGVHGFSSDDINNIGAASDVDFRYEDQQLGRLNSFFLRTNYNYDKRYYFTFTARADGSTKFGPNNQWGFFPSGAIMWNIANEKFLKDHSIISDLRLRASYGRTGLANLPEFQFALAYGALNANGTQSYGGVPSVISNGVPNPDLKWETTDQFDLALEFNLLDYKLIGNINYYNNKTKGLLLNSPISPTTGSSRQTQNVADITNKGMELELGTERLKLGPVNWSSSFNVAFNRNRLDALNGGSLTQFGNPNTVREGSPLGVIFGYEVESIFQNQEEIDALNESAPNGVYQDMRGMEVGAYKFRDLNGDGEITQDDRKELGNSLPKFFGGWNNTFLYKNFAITTNFQFVQGNKKVWADLTNFILLPSLDRNSLVDVLEDTWTPDNPNAQYEFVRFGTRRSGSDERNSGEIDREVFDASFFRFKSLRLSYDLPQSVVQRLSMRHIQIYVTANNLWTSSKWPGLDPEVVTSSSPGNPITTANSALAWDQGPLLRNYSFGVSIGL